VEPLPQEISEFLDKNISCVEQLEILRVLKENPEKEWDAAELGRAVQAKPEDVASYIVVMESRGLLTLIGEKNHTCRFGPLPGVEGIVERLLQLYKERPVSMIRFVYDKAAIHLRTFADAFRIKEDKKP
jgi:hypothetical protein